MYPSKSIVSICMILCYLVSVQISDQNATVDPSEARALNLIFSKWRISADSTKWNISGNVCSGTALEPVDSTFRDLTPSIKCNCTFTDSTICHITSVNIYKMDVVGEIPQELWTLTYLENLEFGKNYLTGSLPSAIGMLTRISYMSFGINALSGELPKELGNLTRLNTLNLGTNNFSGSLPPEFGMLVNLRLLIIDSSGISGPIPSTFASLVQMGIFWASDTKLTGNLPDFIGNWSRLVSLRFYGNSLEGPIPSSYSKLSSLSELRINGLSNGGFLSEELVRNMKYIITLDLRNNSLFGSIPRSIGELEHLTQLDLRFNNLYGQIPPSIFTSSSLQFLFLGNNKLNGTIPPQKSSALVFLDLSYNNLTGSLPTWISDPNIKVNLVANNLIVENSNTSGLTCPQKNFPCNRGVVRRNNKVGLIIGVVVGVGGLCITLAFGILYVIHIRKYNRVGGDSDIDKKAPIFSYDELKNATNNFDAGNVVGKGAFGRVYKGTLGDGRLIAVKELFQESEQGMNDFVNEIATISIAKHRNLVDLYGCCTNGSKRFIVFEYLENKSLDRALFGNDIILDWSTRQDICLGVAKGLEYLHEGTRTRIIHRDIKCQNILLDSKLVPKIADFGLAKFHEEENSHLLSNAKGTFGYIAPEYISYGELSEKTDVFAFGIMTLEVVSGRRNGYIQDRYILVTARELYKNNCIIDLVDNKLSEFNQEEAKRLVLIGLLCCQASPSLRPSMSRVVAMITGVIEVNTLTLDTPETEYNQEELLALIGQTYNNTTSIPLAETLSGGR